MTNDKVCIAGDQIQSLAVVAVTDFGIPASSFIDKFKDAVRRRISQLDNK
jgi:hypothetical protein